MDNQKLVEIENEEAVGGVGKVAVRATMEEVTKNSSALPDVGALVEGRVIAKEKMSLYVEIIPFGTGIIFGREYLNARDVIKKVNIGDLVTAKVVALEGEEGYFELSLKEAKQALVWSDAEKAIKSKAVFDVMVKDANKGGLILEWQGIQGFLRGRELPVALSFENYQR